MIHDNCDNFSYLVTYAPPKSRYTADAAEAIRIWDTRIADMKRAFPGGFGVVKAWPHFKWSFDDKYFASMRDDVISIYESEVWDKITLLFNKAKSS